jgi:hypothetical protein
VVAGLSLLTLHFTLVVIYAKPYGSSKNKWDYYAQWYVYPYFQQNWNLFVPPPDCNYRLFAEFEDKGIQKVDVFGELVIKHQSNRLKGYGPVLIAFINSIHYFEKNTPAQEKINGPVSDDANFKLLERSVVNYLEYTRHISTNKIKLVLLVENVAGKTRVYFN